MIETDTPLARLAQEILDNACPNGGIDGEWHTYIIETHCVAWHVTARIEGKRWIIRKITSENC